jgi:hypothetical protein
MPPGPPGPPGSSGAQPPPASAEGGGRPPRQDRRPPRGERPSRAQQGGTPPGPPGPGGSAGGRPSRTHRSPGSTERPPSSGAGDRPARNERGPQRSERPASRGDRGPSRGGSGGGGDRSSRDRGSSRTLEPPVPQDPLSIELGAKFREAQIAIRDARKALEKKKAESGEAPEWMVEQLTTLEQAFEVVATEWAEHLATTGRKVIRR